MSRRLNVGYVGWLSHDDTEFCRPHAVCDVNEKRLGEYRARHPDVKAYTDYRALADDPELDVVIVSTPNFLHCEMSVLFLDEGKHVFCEKPMGVDRDEMNRMLRAQRRSGRQLAIDFEMRVSSSTRRVRGIVDSGELGRIVGVEFVHHRGCWLPEGAGRWRLDPAKSGGLYFMEVCHEVDFFRWIAGEITHVQSFKASNVLPQYQEGMPDNVFSHFFFESGAMGSVSTAHGLSVWTARPEEYGEMGHDMFLIVTGDRGALRLDAVNNKILVVKLREYPAGSRGRRPEFDRVEEFADEHACHDINGNRLAFLRACAEGRPHHQSAHDAWRTHCVCLAAEQSAREDFRRIEVDYAEPKESQSLSVGGGR